MAVKVKGNLKMTHANCPACHSSIGQDRLVGTQAYCVCGFSWNINGSNKMKDIDAKNSSAPLVIFAIVMVLSLFHYFTWDNFSFQIISLKIQQYAGFASREDFNSLAIICEARKKPSCQVGALLAAFEKDPKDLTRLSLAGEVYVHQEKFEQARVVYENYFKQGGKSLAARELYAQALTTLGDLKGAEIQYKKILASDKKEPNYVAARSYVEVLLKCREYSEAKKVIEEYRKAGPTSALFLEKEWKMLNAAAYARTNNRVATQNRAPASRYR